MPNNLQALISAIATAAEGHVITSDYHNTVRAALVEIANQLGAGPGSETITLTFAPNFQQNDTGPNWFMLNGLASVPAGGSANGWLPLQLPDGARLQSLIVQGQKKGTIPSFHVKLLRTTIADGATAQLIDLGLTDKPFPASAGINILGAGPAAIEEYKQIDNINYAYLVTAILVGADGNNTAQISAIQVVCSRA